MSQATAKHMSQATAKRMGRVYALCSRLLSVVALSASPRTHPLRGVALGALRRPHHLRVVALGACLIALASAGGTLPTAALAVTPRTTLPAVESQVMCVTCKISLEVAQSPQADRERAFIARMIAAGMNEAQIKRALVHEYGPAVLALPSGHGFDLAVYLVPPAVVLAVLAVLTVLLPRWRRRARAAPGAGDDAAPPHPLSPADAARLDADIARFG
jgi:cytochrome c-type biogenesis protein CcmH